MLTNGLPYLYKRAELAKCATFSYAAKKGKEGMKMDLQPLRPQEKKRAREFLTYNDIERARIVYGYLFEGQSTRSLDRTVLGLDPAVSRGYQSHNVLRYLGIAGVHKQACRDVSLDTVIDRLNGWGPDWMHVAYYLDVYRYAVQTSDQLFEGNVVDERMTERRAVQIARIGQSHFRRALLQRDERCLLCEMEQRELLVASHMKPWRDANDWERLDVANGLLLCAGHDRAFDVGLITFEPSGQIVYSDALHDTTARLLHLHPRLHIPLTSDQRPYVEWHNEHVFQAH